MLPRHRSIYFLVAALAGSCVRGARAGQQISKLDRSRAEGMLQVIAKDVSKHYYDPKMHGLDWGAKVREADEQISQAPTLGLAFSDIAAALGSLGDSHTFFVPPQRAYRTDYGWRIQMIGSQCLVTAVRPGSDAAAKGVKPGDEVVRLDGWTLNRDNLWRMEYILNVLQPQAALRADLRDPEGHERQLEIAAKRRDLPRVRDLTGNGIFDLLREMENQQHLTRVRSVNVGEDLLVVRLPEFFFTDIEVNDVISKARKHPALIVDLRGNPGGAVETLKYLVGGIFDEEIQIADEVGRDKSKPLIAKSTGRGAYTGKLVVLIDSDSASAAELFARIVQLEKRGLVFGDASSGKVMEAKLYSYQMGEDTVFFYGASITYADLLMRDGKSLENVGVTPDEIVLPTADDLATGRDPVLARAAATLGVKLSPEEAGKLFPIEWPQD